MTYTSIGGTRSSELLTRPPAGYRPLRRRARIGHGDARWQYACAAVMSWGIQRNSGFQVSAPDAPAAVTGQAPIAAELGPDGTPFLARGDSVVLSIPFGPFRVKAPARVVYVVDEVSRRGFAYGSLPGHPESGEESFIVEQADDGSVWLEISAFSRPAHIGWSLVYPVLRLSQEFYTRRYFTSLSGPLD